MDFVVFMSRAYPRIVQTRNHGKRTKREGRAPSRPECENDNKDNDCPGCPREGNTRICSRLTPLTGTRSVYQFVFYFFTSPVLPLLHDSRMRPHVPGAPFFPRHERSIRIAANPAGADAARECVNGSSRRVAHTPSFSSMSTCPIREASVLSGVQGRV